MPSSSRLREAQMRAVTVTGRESRAALAALLVAAAFVSGCAMTEREYLQSRAPVDELAEKVAHLERSLAEAQRDRVGQASAAQAPDEKLRRRVDEQGKGLADLRARVDELSLQIAGLSGRLEVLEKAGSSARESARAGASQLETRLSDLEKKLEKLQTAAARAPEPQRPAPSPLEGEKPQPPAVVEKRSPFQVLYEEAYDLYRKQGKPEEAREKFRTLITTYPEAPLVPNAYFWIGESYYDQGQYEPAILEYDNVVKKFPKSDKVPSALLKEAFAFDKLGDAVGARALLKKLLREYPKADQAAIAQKKLDSIGE